MATATKEITIKVDPDELGVLGRHDLLMQTDANYRKEALTPPGGKRPGEDGKPASPLPDEVSLPTAIPGGTVAS